jgi:release factor glutamine methyltransferase
MQNPDRSFQEKLLLASILQTDVQNIFTGQYSLNDEQKSEYESKKSLLAQGYPLDYLLGKVKFLEQSFIITPDVLIPRPETEDWIFGLQHKFSNPKYQEYALVDIGCGSGVIGLSLAKCFKKVILSDISKEALLVAKQNSEQLNIQNTEFIQSDLLQFVLENKVDLVDWILIANLPYVPTADKQFSKENNISFEPEVAIFSGVDGLDLYRQLVKQLEIIQLKPEKCFFELDPRNVNPAKSLLHQLYPVVEISKDQAGLERFLSSGNTNKKN